MRIHQSHQRDESYHPSQSKYSQSNSSKRNRERVRGLVPFSP